MKTLFLLVLVCGCSASQGIESIEALNRYSSIRAAFSGNPDLGFYESAVTENLDLIAAWPSRAMFFRQVLDSANSGGIDRFLLVEIVRETDSWPRYAAFALIGKGQSFRTFVAGSANDFLRTKESSISDPSGGEWAEFKVKSTPFEAHDGLDPLLKFATTVAVHAAGLKNPFHAPPPWSFWHGDLCMVSGFGWAGDAMFSRGFYDLSRAKRAPKVDPKNPSRIAVLNQYREMCQPIVEALESLFLELRR